MTHEWFPEEPLEEGPVGPEEEGIAPEEEPGLDMDLFEEEGPPEEEEEEEGLTANRTFIFAVAGLVLFMLVALCFMGTYALVIRPRQQAARATQVAMITQTAEAQAVLAAAQTATAQYVLAQTATAQAQPTATPTPTATFTPRPSPTPVVAKATDTPSLTATQTPTPGLNLLAIQQAATQTALALTAGVEAQLPATGFGTDGGNLWLWGVLALLLLVLIVVLRRLRALSS